MLPSTLYIASDHAGVALKSDLKAFLEDKGWKVEDLGPFTEESCDYPVFAHQLCENVLATGHKGILICGTGIGMCITANRYAGIRAALCTHEFQARATRQHNDANVLCLAARITAPGLAQVMTEEFLTAEFEGGRHQRRIDMIEKQ